MDQMLIAILTFLAVFALGGAIVLARSSRRQIIQARLEEFGTLSDRGLATKAPRQALTNLLSSIGARVAPEKESHGVREQLAHAGFYHPTAAAIYVGARMLVLVSGLVVAAVVVLPMDWSLPVKCMAVLGAAWVCSLVPSLYIDIRKARRATQVRHHLPDAVDLMEICVTAGMGLDMAWNAVTDEIRRVSPILADEMALTNLEIHLGATRADAMRRMAKRTGSDEVNALVGTLVQSERFGTSIATALRTFADSMREQRSARASENAEKVGIKMLVPMILFILPSILIVMGGTAFLRIREMFQIM